ncbi:MAG TPA: J domain-containing protein, partial [Kofleriaceae bacterium]|nr:J domain-containing protein [Kofleriaceae bacterium]
ADPFQALGLAYDADQATIRRTFLTATKVFHPNRFARRDREVLRVANEVYLRVKAAYQAIEAEEVRSRVLAKLGKHRADPATAPTNGQLASGTSPPAPHPTRMPTAPMAIQATEATMRIPRLRETTAADVTEQVLDRQRAARAELNQAKQLLNEGRLEDARKRFHTLAAEHPSEKTFRAWLHYAIGRQREAASEPERARVEFRRALELDDSFEEARSAMAKLPGDGEPRGLFSRLFRK